MSPKRSASSPRRSRRSTTCAPLPNIGVASSAISSPRGCRHSDPPWRGSTTRPQLVRSPAMAKKFKAAVIGGSGYGGAELIRRLLLHPDVSLERVASVDYVGEPLSAAHPNLEGLSHLRFEELPAEKAAEGMDVVLLGLPHKVSAHKVPEI